MKELPRWFTQAFPKLQNKGFELACSKQSDYGPSNITGCGLAGVVVRMNDKMERLKKLVLKDGEAQNESLEDTFMDMANYGIIGLMFMDGSWDPR